MNIAPFTFAPNAPTAIFYADGDRTEHRAANDEDFAVERVLQQCKNYGLLSPWALEAIERQTRTELRGVFDSTVAQFMNDPIISEPTTRHSHQRGAK